MFEKFLEDFAKSFAGDDPVINQVLSNVFSMRIIGNKTHGDLAEIALTEYINDYMYGYSAKHTGKEKFRAKENEEDIRVMNLASKEDIPISIKTYGVGPLQLSTNKTGMMFYRLRSVLGDNSTSDESIIKSILTSGAFVEFDGVNVLPLIYDEKKLEFKIQVFDINKAYNSVKSIKFLPPRRLGSKMTFPIYKFYGEDEQYIFEVRYGGAGANALQRGMWTHTTNAEPFFKVLLYGKYNLNESLIKLIARLLVSTQSVHDSLLEKITKDKNTI